jgi:hypothetical protein
MKLFEIGLSWRQNMSRHRVGFFLTVTIVIFGLSSYLASRPAAAAGEGSKPDNKTASHDDVAAAGAFESILPALHHPRCMNCHSSGDFPRQGDDGHPHAMNVRRGPEGHGVTAQKCSTCHQDHNLAGLDMPPGAPDWHLPPPSTPMVWQGLTPHGLCELLKDPKQNGNRNVEQIVAHMNTPLVQWGWHPGEGRTPVPMSQADFMTKVKEWAANGAACPSS